MKRKASIGLAAAALLLGLTAIAPSSSNPTSSPLSSIERASGQVTKSRGGGSGGGGGSAGKVGENAADLGSGWAIPLTVFLAGVLLVGALLSRNVGAAVGVVLVAMIGLIFFAKPDSIVTFAQQVGEAIF
jgi:hypothetical protein